MPSAKARYEELKRKRDEYLNRARAFAFETIPHICPTEQMLSSKDGRYRVPENSIGADCVNSLASKMALRFMPPNQPSFRLQPRFSDMRDIEEEDPNLAEELLSSFAKYERVVSAAIETSEDRAQLNSFMQHQLIVGDCLWVSLTLDSKIIPLYNYVVSRDEDGFLLECIYVERIHKDLLPGFEDKVKVVDQVTGEETPEEQVEVYTYQYYDREEKNYKLFKEINGKVLEGSEGTFRLDAPPLLPVSFKRNPGEYYGRPYVEYYYGQIKDANYTTRKIQKIIAAQSRNLLAVKPSSMLSADRLAKAEDGAVLYGDLEQDVTSFKFDKSAELQSIQVYLQTVEESLRRAFLMTSSAQRDAERVTATEFTAVVSELESVFGGTYQSLTVNFQRPYLMRKIDLLTKAGQLPSLPEDLVDYVMVTGIDALSRMAEVQKFAQAAQLAQTFLGPDALVKAINPDVLMMRLFDAFSVDSSRIIKSKEDVEAESQQAMQMQMMDKLGPNAVNQVGNILSKSMEMPQGGQEPIQ